MDDNAGSRYYQTLMNALHTLHEYIPENYSTKFRNPCWYDFYQIPTSPLLQTSKCTFQASNNLSLTNQALEQVKNSSKVYLHCLPAYFLPGFPKCATTTLHEKIIKHPLVAQTRCKECGFWTKIVNGKDTDIDKRARTLWYIDIFSQSIQVIESNPQSIMLDASVTYTHSSGKMFCILPVLLMRVLPEARFILIMRNPSERYFSHYWFITVKRSLNLQKQKKNKTKLFQYAHSREALEDFHKYTIDAIMKFQSCVDHENSAFACITKGDGGDLKYSLYYYHLIPWLGIIPRERFLFLRTEDLACDPSLTMSKVWQFLNIHDLPETESKSSNVNQVVKGLTMPPHTKTLLDAFFQPYNELLAHLLSDTRYLWNE